MAREFSKRGHSSTFLTTDQRWSSWNGFIGDDFTPGVYSRNDYTLVRFKSIGFCDKAIPLNWRQFIRLAFHPSVDVVHCTGLGTPLTTAILRLAGKKRPTPPIVISDHSNEKTGARTGVMARQYHRVMGLSLAGVHQNYGRILTYSQDSQKFLSDRFNIPKAKFTVIPLGFDDTVFSFQPNRREGSEDTFRIVFAGKVDAAKRLERLIDAIDQIKSQRKIELHIAGFREDPCEYSRAITQLLQDRQIDSKQLPLLSPRELAVLYNSADLAVFPGSVSITTIEASACGLPVLIYRSVPGLEHRVSQGRGSLFDTDQELLQLLTSQIDKGRPTVAQREQIASHTKRDFSWPRLTDEYEEIYRTLTAQKSAA